MNADSALRELVRRFRDNQRFHESEMFRSEDKVVIEARKASADAWEMAASRLESILDAAGEVEREDIKPDGFDALQIAQCNDIDQLRNWAGCMRKERDHWRQMACSLELTIAGDNGQNPPAPSAGEGFVVVPREPTEAMWKAGAIVCDQHVTRAIQVWCAMLAAAPAAQGAEPDDTYQPVSVAYLQRLWGASFDVIHQGGFDNNSDGFRKAIDHMHKVLAEIRDPVHTNTRLTNFPVFDVDGGPLAALESLSASVPSYLSMSCGGEPATREMVAHRIRERIAAVKDALSAAAPAVVVDESRLKIDVLHMAEHDDFICAAFGQINRGMIEEIEKDLSENSHPAFDSNCDGVYTFEVVYEAGEYGEYGVCHYAPGWCLNFQSFTALNAAMEGK